MVLTRTAGALPDPVSGLNADEIEAICRRLDECAHAIATGTHPPYLVGVLRMVEEDLYRRAASARLDEFLAARTAAARRARRSA
jgi:hypothetical protein